MTTLNFKTDKKARHKIATIIVAFITLIAPFFLMLSNKDNHLETAQSFCPLKLTTCIPCMGCGSTKSMVYCYQGDFPKSLHYHVFGPFLILFCTISILILITELVTQKDFFSKLIFSKTFIFSAAFSLTLYYIVRVFIL